MPRKGENIRKRTDGRWEGRFPAWNEEKGRNVSKSVYAKSYAEVREKLAAAKVLQRQKTVAAGQGMNSSAVSSVDFGCIASKWLDSVKKHRKYSTYIKYNQIYRTHLSYIFAKRNTANISMDEIDEILSNRSISSWSLTKSIYSVANQILKYAHDHYGVPYFPLSPMKEHQTAEQVTVLAQAEQKRLLKDLYMGLEEEDNHYRVGILLSLYTGLRTGEVCALRWDDIDLDGGLLYVKRTVQRIRVEGHATKTVLREDEPKSATSKREIPLPETILVLLKRLYDGSKYVICGNRPAEPRTLYNHYQKHLRNAGIAKKTFHCIRHTFATNCINAGVDVKSLSEILGHADVTITLNRYVHPTIDTKRQHLNRLSAIYGQYLGQEHLKTA